MLRVGLIVPTRGAERSGAAESPGQRRNLKPSAGSGELNEMTKKKKLDFFMDN